MTQDFISLLNAIDEHFIAKIKERIALRERELAASVGSADRSGYRDLVRSHARLRKILDMVLAYRRLRSEEEECRRLADDKSAGAEMMQMAREDLDRIAKAIAEARGGLVAELYPPDPDDDRGIIMEIRAGTGGDEAGLFAGDLTRMYTRYAESRGWKTEFISASPSEKGGYKEVVFSVQGENVYRTLRHEGGTHRVQRVPATEANGRIHTSTATVAVLPEAEDVDDIEIKPEDIRVDVYRASGAGGQHVNKTDSAVRITHLPTGLAVASQEERSQHKNRAKAMRLLRSHLLAMQRKESEEQASDTRRQQIGTGDRSERVRTYNFPQNRLTDHRIDFTSYSLNRIIEGELDPVVHALQDHYQQKRFEQNIKIENLLE